MISCHLSPPLLLPRPHPSLPQRKPAIQSGAEIKSLGAWPGPRPLANEVGERQPKSLPLGLYCLYRGLVIGGYGSGIKRLLPQPLRRVRHSLPPPLLFLPPPFLPHRSVLFERKRKECPSDWVHPWLSPSSSPPSLPASLRLCSLPAQYRVCARLCVCAGCRFSCPPSCLAQWFCGCWLCRSMVSGLMLSVRECKVLFWLF